MKIAAFVLGLILSLIILAGAFYCFFASAVTTGIISITESEKIVTDAQGLANAGGYGLFLAILGITGASLAFKHRIASAILLFLTALGSIAVGIYTPHGNMIVWGGLLFLPTIFAAVEERKDKEERITRRREEEERITRMLIKKYGNKEE